MTAHADAPTHSLARPEVGDRVVIDAGRLQGHDGRVVYIGVDGSCGCWSVIVETDAGEWWGKVSETLPWPRP